MSGISPERWDAVSRRWTRSCPWTEKRDCPKTLRQNQNPLRHSTLTRKAEHLGDPGKPVCLMLLESQIKEDGEAEREVKPRSHRASLQRHLDLI